jgi:ubiquinone biosynthesis protein
VGLCTPRARNLPLTVGVSDSCMTVVELHRPELESLRERVAAEAVALARPRLWTDTIGALAGNVWRGASSFAADTPLLLLGAASGASGIRVGPSSVDSAAIRSTQRLVRRGGPAYIKLGQFIASADGILPAPWVKAFAWCRDDAPRLSGRRVLSIVAREIGSDALAELDPTPLAAGSIAQVHRAVLADGTRVVVKVRRPGLRRQLRADIGALALAAVAAERLGEDMAAANLPGFVELFAQLALEESDFRLEALNLEECAAVFRACEMDWVTVPTPIESLVSERVLVMEHIEGIPYDRAAAALGDRLDGARLLSLAVGGVLKSALLHGVFHGDLHAANVLVRDDGTFGLVDFGICGRFTLAQRRSMVRYLVGFAQSDSHAQVSALRDFGAALTVSDALVAELAEELECLALRADGAVTFERLGENVSNQLSILARHGFRMPKELVLFFKNLLYLSSFAAAVAPQADLFAVIESVLGGIGENHANELAQLLAAH